MALHYFEGVGRRKEAIARVRVMNGSGQFTVNEKEGPIYFGRLGDMETILLPFKAAGQDAKSFDVTVIVKGGGVRLADP
jgi:small subunit ribosomal protein S9